MGRIKGASHDLSFSSAARLETIKGNIKRRLAVLNIGPTRAALEVGRSRSWLSDVLLDDRYQMKLSIGMVQDIADALNVEFLDLASNSPVAAKRLDEARAPKWLLNWRETHGEEASP